MKKPEIITQNTHHTPKIPSIIYDSNPFTLVFNSLGRMFETNLLWVIGIIVLYGIYLVFNFILQILVTLIPSDSTSALSSEAGTATLVSLIFMSVAIFIGVTIVVLIAVAIQVYIMGLLSYIALRSEEGHKVSFGEGLEAVNQRYVRLFLSLNFAWIKICLWTLLFIIPGIIAALRYTLLIYVIMSEPATAKGISSSHKRSRSITKGRLVEVFSISTIAAVLPVINYVAALSGGAAQYRQMAYYTDHSLNRPKIHWLNWATFGTIVLMIALFVIITVASIAILVIAS